MECHSGYGDNMSWKKIMRIDFVEGVQDSDGNFLEGMDQKMCVLFNQDVISSQEVVDLIHSGEYMYDMRIVVTTSEQADNLRGGKHGN